jgi:hypothetical protein
MSFCFFLLQSSNPIQVKRLESSTIVWLVRRKLLFRKRLHAYSARVRYAQYNDTPTLPFARTAILVGESNSNFWYRAGR